MFCRHRVKIQPCTLKILLGSTAGAGVDDSLLLAVKLLYAYTKFLPVPAELNRNLYNGIWTLTRMCCRHSIP